MFCYLVYASSQSRGAEKSQLHKGSSAVSFCFFASVSPAQYTRRSVTKWNWSHLQEFWSSEGVWPPPCLRGSRRGPAAYEDLRPERGPARWSGFRAGAPVLREDRPGPSLSSCVWTNASLSNKIQRDSKGLQVTQRMCSWSKLRTKGTKRPKKPDCRFWRVRSMSRALRLPPGRSTPKGRRPPGHPPAPALDTRKQLSPPRGVSRGGVCALTLCSRAQSLAWAPCWPLVTFCWLRRTGALIGLTPCFQIRSGPESLGHVFVFLISRSCRGSQTWELVNNFGDKSYILTKNFPHHHPKQIYNSPLGRLAFAVIMPLTLLELGTH